MAACPYGARHFNWGHPTLPSDELNPDQHCLGKLGIDLFLLGAELFKEYYSGTEHLLFTQYFWSGIGEHRGLVPDAWTSLICSLAAFLLFLHPATRQRFATLNLGCHRSDDRR